MEAVRKTPQKRDAEATKANILDFAEAEFARNGLSGARTEDIAQAAGVTKAMVFYYFDSKEQLYEAVLKRTFGERLKAIQDVANQDLAPKELLIQILNNMICGTAGNPRWTNIIMYEAMQNKGQYYSKIVQPSIYSIIAKVLEEGMARGDFRELEPMHAAVNIVGMCTFYFCAQENLKHLWPDKSILSREMVEQHRDQVIAMLLNGIVLVSP